MGKKEQKPAKGADKKGKKAAKTADKPGTAKYTYPKDCTTDADKKKYRSLMRAGKEWEGPGKSGKSEKKGKKDPGPAKAVVLDGKGKKIREEVHAEPAKKKKKKSED